MHNYSCSEDTIVDNIRYIIVSTGYEANLLKNSISSIDEFNRLHDCKLLLVWDNKDVNNPNYNTKKWSKNIHNQLEYNLLVNIIKYIDMIKLNNNISDTFMIFETSCDESNINYNGHNAFRILSDIEDLNFCHIWSPYFVDFKTLRKDFYAVYANFDAEGG